MRRPLRHVNAPANGVLKHLWLIKNFFEHKIIKTGFLRFSLIPVNFGNSLLDSFVFEIKYFNLLSGNFSKFPVIQVSYPLGVWQKRGNVACHIVLLIPVTDYQRTAKARGHDPIWFFGRNNQDAISSADFFQGKTHCFSQPPSLPFSLSSFQRRGL